MILANSANEGGSSMTTLADRWAEESARHPGMTKDTFVQNYLFGEHGLSELIAFLKDDPSLHGRVFESTSIASPEMVKEPDRGDGLNWWHVDLSQPHVVLKIQIEVVTDGLGHIQRNAQQRWYDYDHDD